MALITRTYGSSTANPVATGSTILAAHVNTDLDTVYSAINGNIDDANIKSGAAIAISKTTLGNYTAPLTWTPGFTGFSVNPSTTYARYSQIGKYVILTAEFGIDGTSNANTLTITGVPVASLRDVSFSLMGAADNGNFINTGYATILAGTTTISCKKDHTGTVWTTSGQKSPGLFYVVYEVA